MKVIQSSKLQQQYQEKFFRNFLQTCKKPFYILFIHYCFLYIWWCFVDLGIELAESQNQEVDVSCLPTVTVGDINPNTRRTDIKTECLGKCIHTLCIIMFGITSAHCFISVYIVKARLTICTQFIRTVPFLQPQTYCQTG